MSEFLSTADAESEHANDRRNRSAVSPIRATDGERLMRFWRHRDESAFAEVVEIHAGLVWGVCSQVLRRREDVEDAFQATFLILARKAKSIRAADSAAGWLYRVAFRTALLARQRRLRRSEERLLHEPATDDDQLEAIARNEQCLVLLEELHALPMRYRQPLVLCYLEGRSRSEAANELGVTPQTVKGAPARGTRMLRSRLVSRGAALSTAMAATTAAMASAHALAAPAMAASTAGLAASFAMKSTFGSIGSALKSSAAVTLAEKGILAMTITAAAKPAAIVLAVCLATGMWGVAAAEKREGEGAAAPASAVLLAETAEPADAAAEAKASEVPVDVQPSDPAAAAAEPPHVQPPLPTPAAPLAAPPTSMPTPYNPYREPRMAVSEPVQRSIDPSEAPNEAAELQAVELEMEHWDLKAEGLEKKGQVLALKTQRLKASGQATGTEILEMEAEAALMGAEMLLCQSNSIRLKDTIRQLESRHAKRHAAASLAPLQPALSPPALTPDVMGNSFYYGTPAQPVPAAQGWNPTPAAAQPWTPQPAAAIPAAPTPMPEPAPPQWNNSGTGEAPTPAPATTKPRTTAVPAPSGWAVQAQAAPPHARFVVTSESPEEMMRKFDAKRAANPQMSDAEFLRAFVNEKLRELQASNALGLAESQPAYRAPQPMLAHPAPRPEPAAGISVEELAKLKKENAALKKQLEAGEKAEGGEK